MTSVLVIYSLILWVFYPRKLGEGCFRPKVPEALCFHIHLIFLTPYEVSNVSCFIDQR